MTPYDETNPTGASVPENQPDYSPASAQTPADESAAPASPAASEDGSYRMSGADIPHAETAYSAPQQPQSESTAYAGSSYTGAPNFGASSYQAAPNPGANAYSAPGAAPFVPYTPENGGKAKKPKKEKKPHPGRGKRIASLAVTAAVALVFGVGGGVLGNLLTTQSGNTVVYQSSGSPSSSVTSDGATTLSDVVSSVENSVVSLTTEKVSTGSIFGNYVTSGAGSGVIISEDGYIITNQHVIDSASKITVTTKDGTSYTATLVGANENADIAVVKIDASGLTPAVLGDSDEVKAGDTAIVIGNPLGTLGGSVTYGIISATDRELTVNGSTKDLIQTDASVSPGNSGGALFNGSGELVGIIEAKSSYSEAEGLGFAIPVNTAMSVAQTLIENEGTSVEEAKLGITALTISDDTTAQQYGLSDGTGVYIYKVEDGTAADNAGLQVGDKINTIDGTSVSTSTEVTEIVSAHQPGDEITLNISRGGISGDIKVTLGSSSDTSTESSSSNYSNYFGSYGYNFG